MLFPLNTTNPLASKNLPISLSNKRRKLSQLSYLFNQHMQHKKLSFWCSFEALIYATFPSIKQNKNKLPLAKRVIKKALKITGMVLIGKTCKKHIQCW